MDDWKRVPVHNGPNVVGTLQEQSMAALLDLHQRLMAYRSEKHRHKHILDLDDSINAITTIDDMIEKVCREMYRRRDQTTTTPGQ